MISRVRSDPLSRSEPASCIGTGSGTKRWCAYWFELWPSEALRCGPDGRWRRTGRRLVTGAMLDADANSRW